MKKTYILFILLVVLISLVGCRSKREVSAADFYELYYGDYDINDYWKYKRDFLGNHILEHYSYIDSDGNVSGLSIPTVVEWVYIGDGKLPDDFPQSSQKPLN